MGKFGLFVFLAFCLVGCNSDKSRGWVSLDVAASTPATGWKSYDAGSSGVKLSVPAGWEMVDNSPSSNEKVFAAIRAALPKHYQYSLQGNPAERDLALMDLSPAGLGGGTMDQIVITAEKAPAPGFKSEAMEKVNSSGQQGTPTFIEYVQLPIGKAGHFRSTDQTYNFASGGKVERYTDNYIFGREGYYWTVAFAYRSSDESKMKVLKMKILETIRVSKPDFDAIKVARKAVADKMSAEFQANQKEADRQRDEEGRKKYQEMLADQQREDELHKQRQQEQNIPKDAPSGPQTSGPTSDNTYSPPPTGQGSSEPPPQNNGANGQGQ